MISYLSQVSAWMHSTRKASSLAMLGAIASLSPGEDPLTISAQYVYHSAARTTVIAARLSTSSSLLSHSTGSLFTIPASFTILDDDGDVLVSSSQSIDLHRSDTAIIPSLAHPKPVSTRLPGLALALPPVSGGASSISSVQGNFTVIVPMDSTLPRSLVWRQKVNCQYYDAASKQMSFDGCSPKNVRESELECDCSHLGEFSAAEDEGRVACGDGSIAGVELCDDANLVSAPSIRENEIFIPQAAAGSPGAISTQFHDLGLRV